MRCFIDVDVGEDAQIMIGRCGTRDHGNAHVTLHFPIGKVRRKTHNRKMMPTLLIQCRQCRRDWHSG